MALVDTCVNDELSYENKTPGIDNLIPMCDLAGFACLISWTTTLIWFQGITISPSMHSTEAHLLRVWFFLGAALLACISFVFGESSPRKKTPSCMGAIPFALCLMCVPTLFAHLIYPVCAILWFLTGTGGALFLLVWMERLQILSKKQQVKVFCGSFFSGGILLLLSPFMMETAIGFLVAVLPVASFVLLLLAWKFYGQSDEHGFTINAQKTPLKAFFNDIPFEDDRRLVLRKALHAFLHSVLFGFVAGIILKMPQHPIGEMTLGFSIGLAAMAMGVLLSVAENRVCNDLPLFFIPVSGASLLFFCFLWPSCITYLFAGVMFCFLSCCEILDFYTAYTPSVYDRVRSIWEIRSAEMGRQMGFLLGWSISIIEYLIFQNEHYFILAFCFATFVIVVLLNDLFFKQPKFLFEAELLLHKKRIGEGQSVDLLQGVFSNEEKWRFVCDDLSEKYKLSQRQKEIFILLSKGRNVQYIREKLVLSSTTVKSHIYAIYQKMEIHSHQELIDVVEQAMVDGK